MYRRVMQCIGFLILFVLISGTGSVQGQTRLAWQNPGKDFHDALPLGNGDIVVSAWSEQDGDLVFYLSKSDAYDDNNRLLKLGRIRIHLTPNPFSGTTKYTEELDVKKGILEINSDRSDQKMNLRLWVDANNPVVHVDVTGNKKFNVKVGLENWRRKGFQITDTAFSDVFANSIGGSLSTLPAWQYPDTILHQSQRIIWCHENKSSCWSKSLSLQGLDAFARTSADPLLGRVFGASISGAGLRSENDTTLISAGPATEQNISITVLTQQNSSVANWLSSLRDEESGLQKLKAGQAFKAHTAWWEQFWNRSWIDVSTKNDTGKNISLGYNMQRWLNACSGRGKGWIKFNGSLFTLPWRNGDPDYRQWGPASWFQNARLVYWPMLASGDFDLIAPFFGTFINALPLTKARTQEYYGHPGAFFSETMYTWGSYTNGDYGYDRTGLAPGYAVNTYIHYYWSGGLELTTMMLDQYALTQNENFLRDTLLPLAREIITFYGTHWKTGPDGKILFDPAQSLETWQKSTNPTPDIAGLKYDIERLLQIKSSQISQSDKAAWIETLGKIPALPLKKSGDSTYILPAEKFAAESNSENPELYAVFPYRIFGIEKPNLQTGLNSFAVRLHRENYCWYQDEIQAALLGLGVEAGNGLAKRMTDWNKDFRFPAYGGPSNDELPDMDHGGVGQQALQYMILQSDGDKIYLFPAWPSTWDVDFKLHAPKGTTIEGKLKNGKIEHLVVTPESRRKDIVVQFGN